MKILLDEDEDALVSLPLLQDDKGLAQFQVLSEVIEMGAG